MASELGVLTLDMVARTANFDQPLRRSNQVMTETGRNVSSVTDRIERDTGRMNVAFGSMGGHIKAALAGFTVGTIITMADGYTQMAARIRNATENTAEYNMVQQHLYETANGTYRALSEAQDVFLGLNGGMQSLGKTTQQTLAVSDSLSYAFVHNASQADQAQSAINALSKAMATQKVDSDGWISLISAADNIIDDLAATTGKSTSEIRKLGVEGKISLDDLLKTLEVTRDKNKELADSMENSLADGFQKATNAITVYVGQANQATGATSIMASGLSVFADNIGTVVNGVMVIGAYMAGTYIPAIYAGAAAGTAKVIQLGQQVIAENAVIQAERTRAAQSVATAQATLTALAAEKALEVQRLASQINAQGRMASVTRMAELRRIETQVTRELTVAESALAAAQGRTAVTGGALLGMLGGPVGIGLTVATVAAGYLMLKDNSDSATKSLANQIPTVEELTKQYQNLNAVQAQIESKKIRDELEEQKSELFEAEKALLKYTDTLKSGFSGVSMNQVERMDDLIGQVHKGTISANAAFLELKRDSAIPQNVLDKFANLAINVDTAKDSVKNLEDRQKLLSNAFQVSGNSAFTAASQILVNTAELKANALAAAGATQALSEYAQQALDAGRKAQITQNLMSKGYKHSVAQDLADIAAKNGKVTTQEASAILYKNQQIEKLNKTVEVQRKSEAAANKKPKEAKPKDTAAEESRLREQITYGSYSRLTQMHADYMRDVQDINNAKFGSEAQKYLTLAEQRYKYNEELYLRSLTAEMQDFEWSEEYKSNYAYQTKVLEINESRELEGDLKDVRLQYLDAQHKYELGNLDFEKRKRISDAGEMFRNDIQNIDVRYAFEREQIGRNFKITEDEQRKLIQMSEAAQQLEKRKKYESAASAWGGTFADMTGNSDQYNIDQTRFSRYDESQDLFDSQMALADTAAQREAIWQAHNDRIFDIEYSANMARMQLQMSYGTSITSSMTTIMSALGGEQSKGYRIMYAASKAFAVANATIALVENVSNASKIGFPYNLPMIAGAFSQGAMIASILSGSSEPKGYAGGGYTGDGGKYDYAGSVHKGEVVWSQEDLRAWGGKDVVDSLRTQRSFTSSSSRSNPKLNIGDSSKVTMQIMINNYSNAEVKAQQSADGTVTIDILDQKIAQSWSNVRRGNSDESQAIQAAFGLTPARG